jgi:hypothetical protein
MPQTALDDNRVKNLKTLLNQAKSINIMTNPLDFTTAAENWLQTVV